MRERILILLIAVGASFFMGAEKPADDKRTAEKEALADLQVFIGDWRGGGQRERGSTKGAWVESAGWAWKFSDDSAAIVFSAPKGKIYTAGTITPGPERGVYRLVAKPNGREGQDLFTGKLSPKGRLTFTADEQVPGQPTSISLRLVAGGKRLVMVYQELSTSSNRMRFLAEVGYTRRGSRFGEEVEVPECVITGGEAAIPVSYQGKTYYVCCSGCQDYFYEDPAKALAKYEARLAEKRKKREP